MPWEQRGVIGQRRDLVALIESGFSVAEAARRAGISRKTGSKWWNRYRDQGLEELLADRSRARLTRPGWETPPVMVELTCGVRDRFPTWGGGRKIRTVLIREGHPDVPAASTITAILQREGRIQPPVRPSRNYIRFEAAEPNQLWQMDFKGDFDLAAGGRCYPLTVIDDHSRFLMSLNACTDEGRLTVRSHLETTFREFGMPGTIICDHGPPWGYTPSHPYTRLGLWLISAGIHVIHGRPHHPQTRGKNERIHRTLAEDVLSRPEPWDSINQVQHAFDQWRPIYNHYRPHQGIGMAVPADRYQPSTRPYPEVILPPDYPHPANVRSVDNNGQTSWKGRKITVGHAFTGQRVLVGELEDGSTTITYYNTLIKIIEPGHNL